MAYGANILTNSSAETQDLTGWTTGVNVSKTDTLDSDWMDCKEISNLSISGGELILVV
jgi:hypothetical protein